MEVLDFASISAYFNYKNHDNDFCVLSEQTRNDLNIDDLFIFVDRTHSCVGQQFLYNQLNSISKNKNLISQNENIVDFLQKNEKEQNSINTNLSKLSAADAYNIVNLLSKNHDIISTKQSYIFYVLSILPLLSLFWLIFSPSLLTICFFIVCFLINIAIHYWNRRNVWGYLSTIPQLIKMIKVANSLCTFSELDNIKTQVPNAVKKLQPLKKLSAWFIDNSITNNEIAMLVWLVIELIKIFFLIEPIALTKSTRILKDKNNDIEILFSFVGLTDCLSSVAFLRKKLPYYCLPQTSANCRLYAQDLYHPLIENCVSNTIEFKEKSAIVTGSNMSGKTTFVRTIGINALLAQTINTACARQFQIKSPIEIYSAINLADSLTEGKSFYLREVETIKNMIEQSTNGKINLFLLDEIFKGTNTTERIASAKAVLSYINRNNNIVVASTHDTELLQLLQNEYDTYYFCESVENNVLSFDYKLKHGNMYQRNAIKLLEISGYPKQIIDEANSVCQKITK